MVHALWNATSEALPDVLSEVVRIWISLTICDQEKHPQESHINCNVKGCQTSWSFNWLKSNCVLLTENLPDECENFLLLDHVVFHPLYVGGRRRLIETTCAVSPGNSDCIRIICGQTLYLKLCHTDNVITKEDYRQSWHLHTLLDQQFWVLKQKRQQSPVPKETNTRSTNLCSNKTTNGQSCNHKLYRNW